MHSACPCTGEQQQQQQQQQLSMWCCLTTAGAAASFVPDSTSSSSSSSSNNSSTCRGAVLSHACHPAGVAFASVAPLSRSCVSWCITSNTPLEHLSLVFFAVQQDCKQAVSSFLLSHRYYDVTALKRDFGEITDYQPPAARHPSSIMNLSNTGGHGRGGQSGRVIGGCPLVHGFPGTQRLAAFAPKHIFGVHAMENHVSMYHTVEVIKNGIPLGAPCMPILPHP
jgi:hypothetical protein